MVIITSRSDAAMNRDAKRRLSIPYPILGDPRGFVFAAYGLHKISAGQSAPTKLRSIVITPNRQIQAILDIEMTSNHAEHTARLVTTAREQEKYSWAPPHAPVLIVPHVFSPDECKIIIGEFETRGGLRIDHPQASSNPQSFKVPVYDYDRQDRIDHVITDQKQIAFLDRRMQERVTPAIKKAFAFDVTRRENFSIARYSGPRSGVEIGHRDNTVNARHRRFALSVGLNDNYEGGELIFREYSNRGYRLDPGAALIFASSLLHEINETTNGVRYNLISHFFDDAAAAQSGIG